VNAQTLLDKLDSVRQTGRDRWVARCPAHQDRAPSLSVREDSGVILVHCFSGSAVQDVVGAVGLELADLFPPRNDAHSVKSERRPLPAADVLRCVAFEALVVAVAASQLGNGNLLDRKGRERVLLAASRLQAAVRETGYAE
jgi:hypothetical protein